MKETETIRETSDKIPKIVTQIRLLGEKFNAQRVVEKIMVSFGEVWSKNLIAKKKIKIFLK